MKLKSATKNRITVEQLKEQLRIKSLELQKRNAEKIREEEKFEHILALSKKKIDKLKSQISQKDEIIRQQAETSAYLRWATHAAGLTLEERVEGGNGKHPDLRPLTLPEILGQLREKNQDLSVRLQKEQQQKNLLTREKERLAAEVNRLREHPETLGLLKKQVTGLENRARELETGYQAILKEKNELIRSYEQILFSKGNGKKNEPLPSELIDELQGDLDKLNQEKETLEKELSNSRRWYDSRLAMEISKFDSKWKHEAKQLRQEKARLGRFADQVMEAEPSAPLWMMTYADMATLMLTFFILYYSIASANLQHFKEAILGQERASIGLIELMDKVEIKERIDKLTGLKSNDILSDMTDLASEQTTLNVATHMSQIVVRVPGQTLFETARAEIQPEARPLLDEIIRIIQKYPNYKVNIRGHTDDLPISTKRFPTNWELSSARATAVLRYFLDKGVETGRMTATGFADSVPLMPNTTETGRSQNRRVEFVLEKK